MKTEFRRVTLSLLPAFALALVPAVPAAQETAAEPQVLRNPEVNQAIHFDISPPLSEMATETGPQIGLHLARPVLYPKLQLLQEAAQRGAAPAADGALQKSVGPLVNATLG